MRESDWFVFPWKCWLFHRLYGIVLVFQGTDRRWIYGCCKSKTHCKALPCAGAVHPCGRFPADGSPGRAAALRRIFSVDQSDLYRAGHGVGIFHIAPKPASKRPAMAASGLHDGRAVAVSARGQVSIFQRRYHYAPSVVSVLCAADPCAAVQPVRCAAARAAGGHRVFSQVVSAVHSCCTADLAAF